ncbi:MAG: hypothetical protein M3Y66_00705 [Actinomycetota bacterium]|nr:hypothetical protein [Actinomycetota bacterium]
MVSFAPTSAGTGEDQRLYLDGRLTQVSCLDCLATVRVKKNSEHHTSVQWSEGSLGACQEFARMSALPGGRPLHAACSRLMATIDKAVREGELEVGAADGY